MLDLICKSPANVCTAPRPRQHWGMGGYVKSNICAINMPHTNNLQQERGEPTWVTPVVKRTVNRRVMNILQLPIWVQLRNYPRSLMLPRQYSPLAHHPYTSINNTFHHLRQSVKLTECTVTLTPPPAGSLPNCTPFYNRNVLANLSLWLGLSPRAPNTTSWDELQWRGNVTTTFSEAIRNEQ